jgi:hypothetical protein
MYQVLVDEAVLSEIVRRLMKAIDPDKNILLAAERGGTFAGRAMWTC